MSAKNKITNGYYYCKRCGLQFPTHQQLGGHLSKGPICPAVLHSSAALASSALASSASQTNNNNNNNSETDTADEDQQDQLQQQQQQQPPRRVRRVVPETIYQLLQRPTHLEHNHIVRPAIIAQPALHWDNVHKFNEMQDAYEEYCVSLRDLYSDEFWSVFGSVYNLRAGVIDRVLSTTKRVFVYKEAKRRYPASVRKIREDTLKYCGDFCAHVMHEVTICLRRFFLPGNVQQLKFKFINPLWAWVEAANEMLRQGHTMHFDPLVMSHETTGQRLYGAGVQFGDVLKFAASKTPRGGKAALFGISFDGGDSGVSTRSVYPICVSALNFNGTDPLQCGLCGFVPIIPVPKSFKDGSDKLNQIFQDARAHVLQTCVGAILDVLEGVARGGFTARLGSDLVRLHPYLVAVRVDSKERKNYFGLKSDRSCATCRFRKGWSSLRKGTPHGKTHIQRLWSLAVDTPIIRQRNSPARRAQKRAAQQLYRHGFTDRKRR